MRLIKSTLSLLLVSTLHVNIAYSDERPEHFEGAVVQGWEQAITILRDANLELQTLSEQQGLSHQDSARIHELSYTMENALAVLATQIKTSSDALEALHLSSETPNLEQTEMLQKQYLKTATPITTTP